MICIIEGCGKKNKKRSNMCSMHNERLRVHGTLEPQPRILKPENYQCAVFGCLKRTKNHAKWCPMHTARWYRTGTTELIDRSKSFIEWYSVDEKTGCFEFNGYRNKGGYGRMRIRGKKLLAHRALYENLVGPIPEGMLLCHKCDNPGCVNPDHMFIGTHQDNVDDMIKKGRNKRRLGKDNSSSKIKNKDIG